MKKEYMIIGNPGGDRWEVICYCDDLGGAKNDLRDYQTNADYPIAMVECNEITREFIEGYTNLASEYQRQIQTVITSLATLEASKDSNKLISHIVRELQKASTNDLQMIDSIITRINQQAESAYNQYCERINGDNED